MSGLEITRLAFPPAAVSPWVNQGEVCISFPPRPFSKPGCRGTAGEEVGNGGEERRVLLAVTAVVCLFRPRWDIRVPCPWMGEISAAGARVSGLRSCPFSWMQDSFENGISAYLLIGRASCSGTWTRSTDRLRSSVRGPPTSPRSVHLCLILVLWPDCVGSPWPRTPSLGPRGGGGGRDLG